MATWHLQTTDTNLALMSETLGIDPFLCKLLANRGIRTKHRAIKFLKPQAKFMHDSESLQGLTAAVAYLREHPHQKLTIYGDYDVDGVCSTTILVKGLAPFVTDIDYYIPHREHEGYGLNRGAIHQLAQAGTEVILACDNGITAIDEIAYANSLGIQVIMIDHHEPVVKKGREHLPEAIIINPKQSKCDYPFKALCAAGLSYKFIQAWYQQAGETLSEQLDRELLIFAAIATLCDVVDLQDENRILVRRGLEALRETVDNLGLAALILEKSIVDVNEEAIGFTIGPCINACGRLDSAMKGVELFLSTERVHATALAKEVSALNDRRKTLTQEAMDLILDQDTHAQTAHQDDVIVLYEPHIHESVAGIVAGRIKDMMYKPTLILTAGEQGAKGSARSIEGYNIHGALSRFTHLFDKFGGHEMAAGLSLQPERIEALRLGLNEDYQAQNLSFQEQIVIDELMPLSQATYRLCETIDVMRPFGKANEAPVFATRAVQLQGLRMIEAKNTLIFTFLTEDNRAIKALCFGRGNIDKLIHAVYNQYDEATAEQIFSGILRHVAPQFDIAYHVELNHYRGQSNVQLRLKDFRLCAT